MAKCKKLLLSCLLGGAACIALGAGLILRGGGTPVKADDNFAPAYTGEFNPQYFTYWAISDTRSDNANADADWRNVTIQDCSSDSSDTDGVSLHLNNKSAVVVFPRLPQERDGQAITYQLSFSAKSDGSIENRLFLRLDYTPTGNTIEQPAGWININNLSDNWTEYVFDISATGQESSYIVFGSVSNICIDNVQIVEKNDKVELFNFVPNGSFSADPNLAGYTLGEKATVVPQRDGSSVFVAGHKIRQAVEWGDRGYIDVSTSYLPEGKYTLSLEWRGNVIGEAINVHQNGSSVGIANSGWMVANWTLFTVEDIDSNYDIRIYGSYNGDISDGRCDATYIRNIQITGADGTEYILNRDLTFKEITYNDGGTETTQTRVWGDTEVTAENPTEAGEVFVGWVDSLTEPTEIYRKGSTIQGVTEDKTLYALYADYAMTEGASIWLGGGAEQSGIRWNTTISAEDKAVLDDLKAVYGTRVVSDDDKYADVTITEWCKPAGGRESFNTVLRNITRDGFDTVMEARSYIEITLTNDSEATRIYADVAEGATKRAIAQVAQAAIVNGEFADDAEKLAILKEIAGTEVA